MTSLTVVAPFHDESAHVAPFLARLTAVLSQMDVDWTIIEVNDGSSDDTLGAADRGAPARFAYQGHRSLPQFRQGLRADGRPRPSPAPMPSC